MRLRRLGIFVLTLTSLACRSEEERGVSREIAVVAFAVNQLREAPHHAKQGPLEQLLAISCEAPAACELKRVCASAYRLHAQAVQVAASITAEAAAQDPAAAARILEGAEKQLAEAKAGAERCVQLQGELTRSYKL